MKLFEVYYMDDCDFETYLTVGNSKDEVEERVVDELHSKCSCLMDVYVCEVNEVDGYKIIVE